MQLGLQIPNFTWGMPPSGIGPTLARIAHTGEEAGYTSIWVMDHLFQIPPVGPAQREMFEAYTTLGFIAGATRTARLGTMVTGVTYREPGLLAKAVTSLDVLSGGRAWLGIGAAWFEREHRGLGFNFPPLRERFERLEEAIKICLQMWSDDDGPFEGKHYRLSETLCSPQPVSQPRVPILIGGSGEKKTLRLVAKYADACNIRGDSPESVRHLLEVLRGHCDDLGRDYASIEKTVISRIDVSKGAGPVLEQLGGYAEAGAQTVIGALTNAETMTPFEVMEKEVFPQIKAL